MPYSVKEIFYSLQGEGFHTGRPTIFCRFSGCNLWSGHEKTRSKAICRFCDTDFVGTDGTFGDIYPDAQTLGNQLASLWPTHNNIPPYVVFTGGEPTLQLDDALIQACHDQGFVIGIETNGTKAVPSGVDWICVSPKPYPKLVQNHGHEIKLVYPQDEDNMHPSHFEQMDFRYFYLQPKADANTTAHTQQTMEYCLAHPQWRLSLQTHKIVGLR